MTPRDRLNILLVDDQPAKLLSYETILADLGENLIKANSARDALEMLVRHQIAVILIDVCMPELDGFELARLIRDHPRYQTTAIIFVSAVQVTDLDLLRGYEQGAVDYVPVPVTPGLLRAKVRVFVDLYRKTRQLEQFNAALEARVAERTAQLADANAALERHNEELERRVEERTREHEAALSRVHQMQKLESLGQLTGGVAHDFNNLLMAIIGQLELLDRRVPDDPTIRRLLAGAMQGAERGAILTKRMLAFARQQDLKTETLDVVSLIENMMEMLSRSLGPSCQLVTDLPDSQHPIATDPNQLELALLNLALNARDAMPSGGEVVIAVRRERLTASTVPSAMPLEYVGISVSDTGCGMDEATVSRATEPFFTTKDTGKGTGLGLSMVDGLMAQSGGFMKIDSVPGRGTMVSLFFVEEELQPVEGSPSLPVALPTIDRACRILLVDDDKLVSESAAAMIEALGYGVVTATSAVDALALLSSDTEIDCVVTDHAMPGMTGLELATQVQHRWPGLPIILSTGYADAMDHSTMPVPFLAKPYRLQTLGNLLSQVLSVDQAKRA
ncbi:MAG: Histidine kinase [Rhodospirillales bacterium]|nr:Histidine kinase [Rhodospirillales bacterium]